MESCKIYLVLFSMLPALSLQISIRTLKEDADILEISTRSTGPCTSSDEREEIQKCRETFLNMKDNITWIAGYQKKASDDKDQKSYPFSGKTADGYVTKGCYGYKHPDSIKHSHTYSKTETSSVYKGHYFFGLGGSPADKTSALTEPYKFRPKCNDGWGSYTSYSKYQNVEDEEIFCKHPDKSYIVQAYSRWTDEDDDNRQISWHCSPPDTNLVTGDCYDYDNWSNSRGEIEDKWDEQICKGTNEVMVGITKSYFVGTTYDDWKFKIRCCKLGKDKAPKPGTCKWNEKTKTSESKPDDNCSGCDNFSATEYSPRIWDENVYFFGMKTKFKEWGATQNRVLQFQTCEFGCKVTNIEILEKPNFVAKGWKVIGRQAIFDCESNSINFGMANEEAVENSVDFTVSQDYTHEVSVSTTFSFSHSFNVGSGNLGFQSSFGMELSAGYSHSWSNGKSQSKGKAFSSATSTSMDKTLDNESGVAAWVVMYTQKLEYKEDKNKAGSGWKEIRVLYTKQCGEKIIKEEGTMRIEAQKFTNLRMDIERMDFDSRRECRDKRRHVGGKSEFQGALLNEWGLEGGQDFPSENSVANNLRRAFWTAMKYEILEPCGKADRSFLQTNYGDISKTTRCMFDSVPYDDINTMDRCKKACSEHGLNMVAYLPDDETSLKSSLSSNPKFSPELEPLKTKYPGCFIRKDLPVFDGTEHSWGDRCIWNGKRFDADDADWTEKYWPVDNQRNYYPLCKTKC